MASRSPHPTSYHHPDQSSRPKPRLQTSGSSIQSQTRYSYLETPVEMQRSTFAPFSSPTNSVIDESPVSPISPARNLPGYPQHDRATPIPEEKAMQVNMQVPPPQLHPAFYAPIAAESASAAPRQYSQPTQSPEPHQPASPLPLKLHHDDGQASTQLITPPTSPHSKKTDLVHLETYNPHSLQGPNVGIANHQPGQVSHPNAVVDPNWKHSLCEADPLCCMGLFCPCMLYGRTMYRLSRKAEKKDGSNLLGYESCNGGCGLFALACGFQGLTSYHGCSLQA